MTYHPQRSFQVRRRLGRGRPVHAGSVAADHGYRAVVGKLAGNSAAGARRDSRPVHQLLAVPGGMRGARPLRGRAAGGAVGSPGPSVHARRAVPVRPGGAPSAVPSRARQAGSREGRPRRQLPMASRDCGAGERVAVLDLRPGRTASWTYRRAMAQLKNGTYLTPPARRWAGLAVDLAQAQDGPQLRRSAAGRLGHARQRDRRARRISA